MRNGRTCYSTQGRSSCVHFACLNMKHAVVACFFAALAAAAIFVSALLGTILLAGVLAVLIIIIGILILLAPAPTPGTIHG